MLSGVLLFCQPVTPISIGYGLKRAQDALNRSMTATLSEVGLSVPQYAILYTLDQTPGISSAELARRSFVTPQTMNELVLDLEASGLVTREPHPDHGRIRQARLTPEGRSKLSLAGRRVATIEERMLSSLTPAERRHLSVWLVACADNLARRELSPTRSRHTR